MSSTHALIQIDSHLGLCMQPFKDSQCRINRHSMNSGFHTF